MAVYAVHNSNGEISNITELRTIILCSLFLLFWLFMLYTIAMARFPILQSFVPSYSVLFSYCFGSLCCTQSQLQSFVTSYSVLFSYGFGCLCCTQQQWRDFKYCRASYQHTLFSFPIVLALYAVHNSNGKIFNITELRTFILCSLFLLFWLLMLYTIAMARFSILQRFVLSYFVLFSYCFGSLCCTQQQWRDFQYYRASYHHTLFSFPIVLAVYAVHNSNGEIFNIAELRTIILCSLFLLIWLFMLYTIAMARFPILQSFVPSDFVLFSYCFGCLCCTQQQWRDFQYCRASYHHTLFSFPIVLAVYAVHNSNGEIFNITELRTIILCSLSLSLL